MCMLCKWLKDGFKEEEEIEVQPIGPHVLGENSSLANHSILLLFEILHRAYLLGFCSGLNHRELWWETGWLAFITSNACLPLRDFSVPEDINWVDWSTFFSFSCGSVGCCVVLGWGVLTSACAGYFKPILPVSFFPFAFCDILHAKPVLYRQAITSLHLFESKQCRALSLEQM